MTISPGWLLRSRTKWLPFSASQLPPVLSFPQPSGHSSPSRSTSNEPLGAIDSGSLADATLLTNHVISASSSTLQSLVLIGMKATSRAALQAARGRARIRSELKVRIETSEREGTRVRIEGTLLISRTTTTSRSERRLPSSVSSWLPLLAIQGNTRLHIGIYRLRLFDGRNSSSHNDAHNDSFLRIKVKWHRLVGRRTAVCAAQWATAARDRKSVRNLEQPNR